MEMLMTSNATLLVSGEEEVLSGPANKIGFWGGPGGRLILTNGRLLFTNRRKTRALWECALSDVLYVGPASNATIWSIALLFITLLLRNGLKVTIKGGQSQRFVVSDRRRWIALTDRQVRGEV